MKLLVPILLTLVLTACGGGGGSSGTSASSAATSSKVAVLTLPNTNGFYTEAVGDLNGDGLDDVVVSGWTMNGTTAYVYIFMQNADGTLTNRTSLLPNNVIAGSQRILLADFDNDGHVDIFIPGFGENNAGMTAQNSVMFWGSGGSYTRSDWTDSSIAHGACTGDLNNDGKIDLVLAGSGVWINNGSRAFTKTNILTNNYFTACAVVKEAASNTIYLAQNNSVAGFKDAIVVYDFTLTLSSSTGYQADASYDTIDVVATDLTGDGNKDFVLSLNGTAVLASGPRQILAYTGTNTYAYSSTLDSKRSHYYAHKLTIGGKDAVLFSGDAGDASIYVGTTKMYPSAFTTMSSSGQYANVYQNATTGKLYMLQLINLNTFYTQEIN
jgi:hypothetical protein